MNFIKRAWVEIDTKALRNNFKAIRKLCNTSIISCVKADAYGHGAVSVAKILSEEKTDMFAVSNISEAIELRENGIKEDILILGYTPFDAVSLLVQYNIIQAVYSFEYAISISKIAKELKTDIKCHLKLDTGMGRIGFQCCDGKISNEIIDTLKLEGLVFGGVFTHFSSADSYNPDDISFTDKQYNSFLSAVSRLEELGFSFDMKHCCNSAGMLVDKNMQLDAVRPGIILYGLAPSDDIDINEEFIPAMSFYSVVSMIKEIEPQTTVSYGRTYISFEKKRIATVSAGYADGVPRLLSNNGFVYINGCKAPIVGRICMDQFCIDITDIKDVKIGDTVEIFGKNISADEVAKSAQTINYEIVCSVTKRVERIYLNEGK